MLFQNVAKTCRVTPSIVKTFWFGYSRPGAAGTRAGRGPTMVLTRCTPRAPLCASEAWPTQAKGASHDVRLRPNDPDALEHLAASSSPDLAGRVIHQQIALRLP